MSNVRLYTVGMADTWAVLLLLHQYDFPVALQKPLHNYLKGMVA